MIQNPYRIRWLLKGAQTLGFLTWALICGCSHVFYQPSGEKFFEPKNDGYNYKELVLTSADGTRLMAWYFPPQQNHRPGDQRSLQGCLGTVVHFHGNGENISSFYPASAWLTRHGYEVLVFDYRGYGASQGTPSQQGLNEDALAALHWALNRCAQAHSPRVFALGQSLGGTVLLRALADLDQSIQPCLQGVIIDSSFLNYKKIAREKLSHFFLTWPFQWLAYILVSNGFSPEDYLPKRTPIPLLVLHGDADEVVPIHHGEEIYLKASPPKEFWLIPQGHHIDAFFRTENTHRARLLQWLQRVAEKP